MGRDINSSTPAATNKESNGPHTNNNNNINKSAATTSPHESRPLIDNLPTNNNPLNHHTHTSSLTAKSISNPPRDNTTTHTCNKTLLSLAGSIQTVSKQYPNSI